MTGPAGSHVVVVSGAAGSGKSTYARRLVQHAPRLLVIDPTGEWEVGGVAEGLERSLTRLLQLQAARVRRFRLACRVQRGEDVDELLRALWGFQEDPTHPDPDRMVAVVVEEADLASRAGERDTGMDYLIQFGRRIVRPLVLCTRRLARISRDATANLQEEGGLVVFRTSEPADLEDLRRRRGKEAEERARALSGHEYIRL